MNKQWLLIGNTKVCPICLGTMYFGTRLDETSSYYLLDQYIESGGNFIDTSNNYATWVPKGQGGESEQTLGKWIKKRSARWDVFIATKVGFPMPADGLEIGLSAKQIETGCEKSLKRLDIETIDLYYAHHDDRKTPLEEVLEAFQRLVKAGKVRFVGASNFMTWRLEEAQWISRLNELPEFCCIQQRFSYLQPVSGADFDPQVVCSAELLDYCQIKKIQLLSYSPLLGGAYCRSDRPVPPQYRSAENKKRIDCLKKVSIELGATPNQVVLAWLIQSEPHTIPIIGVSNPVQLEENMNTLKFSLSEDQIFRLSSAGKILSSHIDAKGKVNKRSK